MCNQFSTNSSNLPLELTNFLSSRQHFKDDELTKRFYNSLSFLIANAGEESSVDENFHGTDMPEFANVDLNIKMDNLFFPIYEDERFNYEGASLSEIAARMDNEELQEMQTLTNVFTELMIFEVGKGNGIYEELCRYVLKLNRAVSQGLADRLQKQIKQHSPNT